MCITTAAFHKEMSNSEFSWMYKRVVLTFDKVAQTKSVNVYIIIDRLLRYCMPISNQMACLVIRTELKVFYFTWILNASRQSY